MGNSIPRDIVRPVLIPVKLVHVPYHLCYLKIPVGNIDFLDSKIDGVSVLVVNIEKPDKKQLPLRYPPIVELQDVGRYAAPDAQIIFIVIVDSYLFRYIISAPIIPKITNSIAIPVSMAMGSSILTDVIMRALCCAEKDEILADLVRKLELS